MTNNIHQMNFTPRFIKQIIVFLFIVFSTTSTYAQSYTKYFNESWANVINKDSAFYITTFTKNGNLYNVSSYWAKSKKLNVMSNYADTSFTQPRGKQIRYFESGEVQDSILYNSMGKKTEYFRYYKSGKLLIHGGYKPGTNKDFSEAFQENGSPIPGYILEREAVFPGGSEGWMKYLTTHLNTKVPTKNKAPKGVYEVVVSFVVSSDGQVVDISTESDPGYGMMKESIRVVANSPKWTPAVLENKPVNAYRRQPITFEVQ